MNGMNLPLVQSKSIERALFPLVTHIQTLLTSRAELSRDEHKAVLVMQMGQKVSQAVEQFVSAGQAVAAENPQQAVSLSEACHMARQAGQAIAELTQYQIDHHTGQIIYPCDRVSLINSAKQLVHAVTKVLVIGDQVTICQLLSAKDRVSHSLNMLVKLSSFPDFMAKFAEFGQHMVELGQVSGERQNDVKSEVERCKIAHMRSALEKATPLLLTASKLYLRHPDNSCAQRLRADVLAHMRLSLDSLAEVVAGVAQARASRGDSQVSDSSLMGQLTTERGLIAQAVQVSYSTDWSRFEQVYNRCLSVCLIISQLQHCPAAWWAAADWLEYYVQTLGNMVLTAMRAHEFFGPSSKVAVENLESFRETWRSVVTNELGHLLLTALESCQQTNGDVKHNNHVGASTSWAGSPPQNQHDYDKPVQPPQRTTSLQHQRLDENHMC